MRKNINGIPYDWKPIKVVSKGVSKHLSQDEVNDIPFCDISSKNIIVSAIVFLIFMLITAVK